MSRGPVLVAGGGGVGRRRLGGDADEGGEIGIAAETARSSASRRPRSRIEKGGDAVGAQRGGPEHGRSLPNVTVPVGVSVDLAAGVTVAVKVTA